MQLTTVESSMLYAVGYDSKTRTLCTNQMMPTIIEGIRLQD